MYEDFLEHGCFATRCVFGGEHIFGLGQLQPAFGEIFETNPLITY